MNGCSNQANDKVVPVLSEIPPLKVYSCDNDSIIISPNAKNALMEVGMTQCMMPFGVLISADQNMTQTINYSDNSMNVHNSYAITKSLNWAVGQVSSGAIGY